MRLLLFLILIVLTSCGKNTLNTHYPRDPKWDLADQIYKNEIARPVFLQLKKERRSLFVCESGFGLRGKGKIQVMHCGFFFYNEMDVSEARELLMRAGNLYLKEINDNERIRPFLVTYPFKPENIEIDIFLFNSDGSQLALEKLHIVSLQEGVLVYMSRNAETKLLTRVYNETFEEATAKLEDKPSITSSKLI